MTLIKEVYFIFDIHLPNPEVFCKVFEENQIYIAVAESIKLSRRTNHITIKYHHFWRFIQKKMIRKCYIDKWEQTVEIFTNPLKEELFIYLRRKLSGWWRKSEAFCFKTREYQNTNNNNNTWMNVYTYYHKLAITQIDR